MMIIRFITVLLLVVSTVTLAGEHSYQLKSPDSKVVLTINLDKQLSYSLKVDGHRIMTDSTAAMTVNNRLFGGPARQLDKATRASVNRLQYPVVAQKSKSVSEHYNELKLSFKDDYAVTFRAFDNGVAYRFSTELAGDIIVNEEQAKFNFADNYQSLFPEEKSFISHNERLYLAKKLGDISQQQFASLPLLVASSQVKAVITETGLRDYPGMWLSGGKANDLNAIFPPYVLKSQLKQGSDRNPEIIKSAAYIAKTSGKRNFPWRIIATSTNDAELLTNQLSYLLADELEIEDPSWIKPGQVAWDWWNANNIHGVDFKAGINTSTYKYYIDFAARSGIEYIIMDEGWYKLGNVLDIVSDIDVEEIIRYGKSKNVDVILWVIWETLDQQLEHALDTFEKWGVAGIKVDFMQRDDQAMVNYYWRIAKAAAKHKLLVDFHGSYKPAGLRRAYPNVMTREGVRGLEHNKWGDYMTSEHNLTLPFIRMLAGPMDYTPGAMTNAQPKNFKSVFNRPMSMNTRAHQLSMYVIYESPLQMLADSPSNYLKEPRTTSFISSVPTVWDETRVLSAKLGDHIVMARRSGEQWFIGVMGNSEARELSIDLSFLGSGNYDMLCFEDGLNADNYASDYKLDTRVVSANGTLKVKLAPNGGWAARLEKK